MENVMIHVRFNNDGSVMEIGERPAGSTAQAWFNHLSRGTADCYEALSGGRGIFRVAREKIDELKKGLS